MMIISLSQEMEEDDKVLAIKPMLISLLHSQVTRRLPVSEVQKTLDRMEQDGVTAWSEVNKILMADEIYLDTKFRSKTQHE